MTYEQMVQRLDMIANDAENSLLEYDRVTLREAIKKLEELGNVYVARDNRSEYYRKLSKLAGEGEE